MAVPNTILVAENEPMLLKVLEFKLRKDGYHVLTASDGREVAEKIRLENSDMLITNLTLSFISGLEVLNLAKKQLSVAIPVIVLADTDAENVVMKALEAGADDFLVKPFSPHELSIRVKKLFKEKMKKSHHFLKTFLLFIFVIFWEVIPANAQHRIHKSANNYDSIFQQVKKYAYSGKRAEAREMCKDILEKNPRNHEARILMARTFAWDKHFDESRYELKTVLDVKPSHQDAIDALLDVELWSAHYEQAVKVADDGLTYFPNHPGFLLKKAKALNKLERYAEAMDALNKVVAPPLQEENSSSKKKVRLATLQQIAEARQMMIDIRPKMIKNSIGVLYMYESFSDIYQPRHLLQVEGKRKFRRGTLIVRPVFVKRFGKNGFAFETDAYPGLAKGMYLYLNAGYSSSKVLPLFRGGIELYTKLPFSFEASLGMRYMDFRSTKVYIYTGSIGKYYGNYWFSFRPFMVPKTNGRSQSFLFTARRYFKKADNFLTLTAGYGFSPDERKAISGADVYRFRSQNASLGFQSAVKRNFLLTGVVRAEHQELTFRKGDYIYFYRIETGLRYRF